MGKRQTGEAFGQTVAYVPGDDPEDLRATRVSAVDVAFGETEFGPRIDVGAAALRSFQESVSSQADWAKEDYRPTSWQNRGQQ